MESCKQSKPIPHAGYDLVRQRRRDRNHEVQRRPVEDRRSRSKGCLALWKGLCPFTFQRVGINYMHLKRMWSMKSYTLRTIETMFHNFWTFSASHAEKRKEDARSLNALHSFPSFCQADSESIRKHVSRYSLRNRKIGFNNTTVWYNVFS